MHWIHCFKKKGIVTYAVTDCLFLYLSLTYFSLLTAWCLQYVSINMLLDFDLPACVFL